MSRKVMLAAVLVLGCLAALTTPTQAAPPACGEERCCAPTSTPETNCNNNGTPATCAWWLLIHQC
jgi:hypothetical protein